MAITRVNIFWSAAQALILMTIMWVWFANACPNYATVDSKGNPSTLQLQCKYGTGFTAGALLIVAVVLLVVALMFPGGGGSGGNPGLLGH